MLPIVIVFAISISLALVVDAWMSPVARPAPRRRRWRALEEFLNRSGLHDVTPREFVVFSIAAGLIAGAICMILSGWLLVAILTAAAGTSVPFVVYVTRADARRVRIQSSLADAMTLLRDSIQSGQDVPEGLASIARYGPMQIRPEFERVVDSMAHGATLRDALVDLRERLADPVLDSCVATLLLNSSLGSTKLTPVLNELANAVREELSVQADIRAQRAKTIWSARVIAAMPVGLLFVMRAIAPDYMSVFDSLSGQLVLAICGASILSGYGWMRWVFRLPGERRVLVG